MDPWFSLLSLIQRDQSRCPRLSGFFGGFLDYAGCDEWLRAFGAADGDARDRFILPGGLVRRQKRVEEQGPSGDGGATAMAAVVGTPPESFGARRVGGERMIRVCSSAEDLAEVFDPTGFVGGWALGEVERVVKAIPELQLPSAVRRDERCPATQWIFRASSWPTTPLKFLLYSWPFLVK